MAERILVIDDNMNDVQLMRRVLERAGYQTSYANSAEDGLRLMDESTPDCIVVDYRMPGMNGYEFSRSVKSNSAYENIPILMLTGADSAQNQVDGLAAGADDFVTKSSDLGVIVARVRALLRVKAYQDRIVEQSEQLRRLYEEVTEKSDRIMALNQRFNRDLQFARRVQEALLPEREFRTMDVEVRSAYIPSETLSGDFYDYFMLDDVLYLFMGDVSGHGLPAAILVSILKSYLHSEVDPTSSLADFMARLNNFFFSASLPSQYATAQLFRFNGTRKKLEFSNAAHPAFLLLKKNTGIVDMIEYPGHLLGAIPDMTFEENALEISAGDLLFTYTDGLTDRRSESGEFYSLDRIAAILKTRGGESLDNVYDHVYRDATSFTATEEYKDDIAFILTRFK
ncbi:MAG TPA: fused response regulator/phosphatase [Thermoanaerobaculia bacterium]|nr:fused response regulator/phosphatase [Thermoanaerobaculia bacterium]